MTHIQAMRMTTEDSLIFKMIFGFLTAPLVLMLVSAMLYTLASA